MVYLLFAKTHDTSNDTTVETSKTTHSTDKHNKNTSIFTQDRLHLISITGVGLIAVVVTVKLFSASTTSAAISPNNTLDAMQLPNMLTGIKSKLETIESKLEIIDSEVRLVNQSIIALDNRLAELAKQSYNENKLSN
jgi:hypothetical protein